MYTYPKDARLGQRFAHLLHFCRREECLPHEKNQLEKLGDLGLYHIERAPGVIWRSVADPKWIAVYLWIFAEICVSLLFYPTITIDWMKYFYSCIPDIPWWFVRLTLYLVSVETIMAFFLRAEGRLLNKELMSEYYGS
jgi:hypothetical protein